MARSKVHHAHQTHPAVVKRLARIIGHLQGVVRMIEAEKSCPEVLQQMSAVMAALVTTRKVFLEDHIKGCIVEAVRDQKVDEAMEELERVLAFMA
jgi:DNA-binding FrmR family transcriptional regulator